MQREHRDGQLAERLDQRIVVVLFDHLFDCAADLGGLVNALPGVVDCVLGAVHPLGQFADMAQDRGGIAGHLVRPGAREIERLRDPFEHFHGPGQMQFGARPGAENESRLGSDHGPVRGCLIRGWAASVRCVPWR